ncbi:HD domain-containing protein [Amycolatopsis alkalitolerans]|uniref:HD domain-containing protein n=1 Tax=Amycolatopsis alkalitolerans TaxID=2547244 RepID=UPI00135CE497|nr:HD domain-containing protein [Amycolatopsis alkalitolerans]
MDVASAHELSQRYLARGLPGRWAHVRATAAVATRIGPLLLAPDERDLLVAASVLHDIGYARPLVLSGFHPLDGARFLRRAGAPMRLCALVANHSAAAGVARLRGLAGELAEFPDEATTLRDALWYCDMSVGVSGEPTTFDRRIADIRMRHVPDSFVVRALDSGGLEARAAAFQRVRLLLVPGAARPAPAGC